MNKSNIGILAYGSLIEEPGAEIEPLIINRINCMTPFKVEYARKSKTRGDGPTLIPSTDFGKKVNAQILVLQNNIDLLSAKSILWRRETRQIGSSKIYTHSKNPSKNKVQVEIINNNFMGIKTIIYTKLLSNINESITPELLSDLAVKSILTKAGDEHKDGIRYLLANKNNGIITEFSVEYENLILNKTDSESLEDAINIMDIKRLK